jgi:hypothetical protein
VWLTIVSMVTIQSSVYSRSWVFSIHCAALFPNFTRSRVLAYVCVWTRLVSIGVSGLDPLRISTLQLLGSL